MGHTYSIRYGFNQRFPVSAREAYNWCIDYKPSDLSLMKIEGKRRMERITDDAIILDETTYSSGKRLEKTKLVRLNRNDLSWTNTHIAGPFRHSQFIYRILPEGKNASRLYFRGLMLYPSTKNLSSRAISKIASDERRQDSRSWRHLAKAMARDLLKDSGR